MIGAGATIFKNVSVKNHTIIEYNVEKGFYVVKVLG
jgi:hypothetical protein